MSIELSTTVNSGLVIPEEAHSLAARVAAAWSDPTRFTVDTGELEKEKEYLVGIPFSVVEVTYHADFKLSERGYITVTGVIAPEDYILPKIQRKRIPGITSIDEMRYRPGDTVKFNDGSTGIRRQLTQLFHHIGIINVGKVSKDSDYDRSWVEWESFTQTDEENNPKNPGEKITIPKITHDHIGRELIINIANGLRVSHIDEYETDVYYLG